MCVRESCVCVYEETSVCVCVCVRALHGVYLHDGQHAAVPHAHTMGIPRGNPHQVSPVPSPLPLHRDQLCQGRERGRQTAAYQGM